MIPFDKIPDLYLEKAKHYATYFANQKVWKEKNKQLLAVLMSEHLGRGESAAKAEAYAKVDPRYLKDLEEAARCIKEAEIGRAGLKSLEMSFDYYRSVNSLEKKKINIL